MFTDVQKAWVERFLGQRLKAGPVLVDAPDTTPATGVGTRGATIRILNYTGADLKLVASSLLFPKTARFAPPPPAIIPGGDGTPRVEAAFAVIESQVGSAHAGGSARYHVESQLRGGFFFISWSGADAKIQADPPYSTALDFVSDSEAGDSYTFVVKADFSDQTSILVDVSNESGFDLTLSSAVLDDRQHSEFEFKPPSKIQSRNSKDFSVTVSGSEHAQGGGTVIYTLADGTRPRSAKMSWIAGGRPIGTMDPNDGAFIVETGGKDRRFNFAVKAHDGPPPASGGHSTITVVNHSGYELADMFVDLNNPSAKLKSQPPDRIQDGGTGSFEVVSDDPHAPETDGFLSYDFDLRDDQMADKPSNIAVNWFIGKPPLTKVVPEKEGFSVEASQAGNDVIFVVTGPPLEFEPPERPRQPTLRAGDNSADGWVEYLQDLLNRHLGTALEENGKFDKKVYDAVIKFQTKHKAEGCLIDGVVGNQTWALLREGMPEKPSTDGRKPHTYVETGQEARWIREKGVVSHDPARDALTMRLVSVGDADEIKERKVRVRVTAPDGQAKVADVPIGPPIQTSKTGQGNEHEVLFAPLSRRFDTKATAPAPGDYVVESYLDRELGGDSFKETVTVA